MLIKSADKYKLLVETSSDMIFTVDLEGNFMFTNKAFKKKLGYSIEEIKKINGFKLVHPEDLANVKKQFAQLLEGETVDNMEYRYKVKDGSYIHILNNASPISDTKGNVIAAYGVARDITQRKKMEEELRKVKGELEKKVDYRTQELIVANDHLSRKIIEHKQAEEALRKSEEKYRTLAENAMDGIYIISPEGFKYINPALEKIFEYESKEVCGKEFNFFDLIHPEDRDLIAKREEARKEGEKLPPIYSFRIITKTGRLKHVEVHTVPLPGEKLRILGILRDITHRKRAEKALKESEEKFRSLAEESPNMIIIHKKGQIVYANKMCEEVMGYKREGLYSPDFNFLKPIAPESREVVKAGFSRHLMGEEIIPYECTIINKEGKRIEVIVNTKLISYDGDSAILAIITDITERKKSEERILIEKAYLDQLFESAQEGIVLVDKKGHVIRVNNEFTQLFGYGPDEVSGRNVDELVVPRGEFNKGVSITKKVAEGKNYAFEAIRQHKDGTRINVSVLASPIAVNGEVVASYAIYRDITERKKAEEQIKKSLEEKEILLHEINHRVKNNMQIISSLLRLQSRTIKDEHVSDMFKVSQNRIKSMALIHETLYKSKDFTKVNFSDYLRNLTTHLFSVYSPESERIRLKLDVGRVYLDINKAIPCGQIINEILSNSLKHAFPEGSEGEISVRMKMDKQGKSSLVIKDTGVGFPKGFDFRKTETLGMQIITDLVNQVDGTIELDREGGTKFKITF